MGLIIGSIDAAATAVTADEAALEVGTTVLVEIFLWFLIAGGALIVGLILRNSSVIEVGPTGRFKQAQAPNPVGQVARRPMYADSRVSQSSRAVEPSTDGVDKQPSRSGVRDTLEFNVYEKIRGLAKLRDEGLITSEEFDEKKRHLLEQV